MAVSSRAKPERVAAAPERGIVLIDLDAQQRRIRGALDAAIARVLAHGQYIMGPEVAELETRLAAFAGVRHAISCASGTDALLIALMAKGVGPGDAVICPAFTYPATPEGIALIGAAPVFVDVDAQTFNIDPAGIEAGVAAAKAAGLRPRAVMAVDLYGLPADYEAVEAAAARHGLWVLADAAQAFGAVYRGRRTGGLGLMAATSFFPAKPLGCYGDGGAIFTSDESLAAVAASIRLHGKGGDKYDIVRVGLNSRLDTLQAAVLLAKLDVFEDEIARRQAVARRYGAQLAHAAIVPTVPDGLQSVWAQYTLRIPGGRRDAVMARLKEKGIATAVYYPRPLHRQPAYAHCPVAAGGVPVAERLSGEVLSLPMHAYLSDEDQDRVIAEVLAALRTA